MRPRPRHRLALLALVACASWACGKKPQSGDGEKPPSLASSVSAAPATAEGPPSAAAAGAASASASDDSDESIPTPGGPLVDLGGAYHPPPPAPDGAPRLYARAMLVPVFAKPNPNARKVGYLRAGTSVATTAESAGTNGCPGGFHAIQPTGFVCVGDKATLDANDPIVRAVSRGPDRSQKLPYMYGTVTRGGPVYARVPTAQDLERLEPNLDEHMRKWKNDPVSGAGYGNDLWYKWSTQPKVDAWDAWEKKLSDPVLPEALREGARLPNLSGLIKEDSVKIDELARRQGVAFLDSFLSEGRRYAISTDLRVMPADRFRPIKGSEYHGVRIGVDVEFPFALIRKKGAKRYTWSASKKKMIEAGDIEYRAFVQLTGKQKMASGVLHYETKDGDWLDDRHASRLDPAKRMPKWGKNGEKWIDVNITKQTLVAFEGEKAVYATLVSSGEDGLLEGARTTKKGIFRIHTKYVTTTMDSDKVGEEFELRDVPYVQYFEEGFALHGAYWHDAFGTPKSHGCINLAPEDARRLFHWT